MMHEAWSTMEGLFQKLTYMIANVFHNGMKYHTEGEKQTCGPFY